jgi:hypothetical protein
MTVKYYGRKWKLLVTLKPELAPYFGAEATPLPSEALEISSDQPTPLKMQFNIQKSVFAQGFWADFTIWNFASETEQIAIQELVGVNFQAGYKDGPYGSIFSGKVWQPFFDRENVVDYKTTLRCLDGLGLLESNFVNATKMAGYDYAGMIATMAKNAHKPIPIGTISPTLSTKQSPRGCTMFGEPPELMRWICQDEDAYSFIENGEWNVAKLAEPYLADPIVIDPETGLIGTPQQWEFGVKFRHLLDPRLKITAPLTVVQIPQSIAIKTRRATVGQFWTALDREFKFKIIGVSYVGDTRGNDWYVDVTGVNVKGKYSDISEFTPLHTR